MSDIQNPVDGLDESISVTSFTDVGTSLLNNEFFERPNIGTGHTVAQSSGNLTIAAGTTANSNFLARSKRKYNGAMKLRYAFLASQRIANTNFEIILADLIGENLTVTVNSAVSISVNFPLGHGFSNTNIGQSMFISPQGLATAIPGRYAIASIPNANTVKFTVAGYPVSGTFTATLFGHSFIRHQYTGTTATNMAFDTQRNGWAAGVTTVPINTSASPGHLVQTDIDGRNIFVGDSLRASTNAFTITQRASRVESLPDTKKPLYLFLWSYNGTTNPASSTTWTLGFVSIENFPNLGVYINGSRTGQGVLPTSNIQNYPNFSTGGANFTNFVAGASTNATVLKNTPGRLLGYTLTNTNAATRYVKLHNSTTAPTAGASVVATIGIPPNGGTVSFFSEGGLAFTTGIGFTTVTGPTAADAVAVAANDIVGTFIWS